MIWQYFPMISGNIRMNFQDVLGGCTLNITYQRIVYEGCYNKLFFTVGKDDRTNPEPAATPVKLLLKLLLHKTAFLFENDARRLCCWEAHYPGRGSSYFKP